MALGRGGADVVRQSRDQSECAISVGMEGGGVRGSFSASTTKVQDGHKGTAVSEAIRLTDSSAL